MILRNPKIQLKKARQKITYSDPCAAGAKSGAVGFEVEFI